METSDKFEKLRRKAEDVIFIAPERRLESLNYDELVHELEVHQTELELQNEELRAAQEELASLNQKYSDLYDFAPCGYLTVDPRGIISQANLTATRLLRIDRRLLTRMSLSAFFWGKHNADFHNALSQAMRTHEGQKLEVELTTRDDEQLSVQMDLVADFAQNGVFKQWRITFTDISERVRAEREKASEERLLREVHHRIKNNMTSILSVISFQRAASRDKEVNAALDGVASRIKVMQKIYDTLYAKEFTDGYLDLAPFLQQLVKDIQFAYAGGRCIRFETGFEDIRLTPKNALPIGIIINELITNCLKYAFPDRNQGRIFISIRKDSGRLLEISIADDGQGMPEEVVGGRSQGFGLSYIRSYCQLNRGEMEITNEAAGGSRAVVRLDLG
jgi:two-component sensor histidine kinase/PAS domain-containing protein